MSLTYYLVISSKGNFLTTQFDVEGDVVEVTQWLNSSLAWRKTHTRLEARAAWKKFTDEGWVPGGCNLSKEWVITES